MEVKKTRDGRRLEKKISTFFRSRWPLNWPRTFQVNAIAPGWFETDMTAPVRTMPLNGEILARTPVGRWAQSEELAGAAVDLAWRASDFVTGTTIRVDGGYSIR